MNKPGHTAYTLPLVGIYDWIKIHLCALWNISTKHNIFVYSTTLNKKTHACIQIQNSYEKYPQNSFSFIYTYHTCMPIQYILKHFFNVPLIILKSINSYIKWLL